MIEPFSPVAHTPAAAPDRLIRLRPRELIRIVFQHLHTVQDEGVLQDGAPAARRGGITEWQARHQDRLISLGWDWIEVHDGLRRLPVVGPRSNLRLLDGQGYDLPPGEEARLLASHIDTLPWQDAVRLELGSAGPEASFPVSLGLGLQVH